MKRLICVLAFLLMAAPALAQVAIPTDYTLTVHLESAPTGTPITTYDFLKSGAVCDQVVVAAPPTVAPNPRYIRFTDPERPTRDCVFDTGVSTGPLFAMPFGGRYIGNLVAKAMSGGVPFASAPSPASNPFVRGAAPAIPAAVRILPQ